jgi:hypothetical protein
VVIKDTIIQPEKRSGDIVQKSVGLFYCTADFLSCHKAPNSISIVYTRQYNKLFDI